MNAHPLGHCTCQTHVDVRGNDPSTGPHKAICHLCGNRVARDEQSLDHVIPARDGGYDGIGNMKLSHRRCNTARSDLPVLRAYSAIAALRSQLETKGLKLTATRAQAALKAECQRWREEVRRLEGGA